MDDENKCTYCGFATESTNEFGETECSNGTHCDIRVRYSILALEPTVPFTSSEVIADLADRYSKAESTIRGIVRPLLA